MCNKITWSVMMLFILSLVVTNPAFVNGQSTAPQSLFLKMIDAMNKVQTARYHFTMNERIKDAFTINKYLDKVQAHPYKVYTYCISVNAGAEVLYIEGENNNEAVVHPNRFPWFNLNLNPKNNLLRKDHYFTLDQSGFSYMSTVFMHYYNAHQDEFIKALKLNTDTVFDGKSCYQLVIDYPEFKWQTYIVKKGETISTIADKFFLNDYMILERNGKTSFSDVRAGEKIILPVVFAKKIVLCVDKKTLLPIEQILFDDKGLFIVLEIKNLIVNQPIPAQEFRTDYKEYGF